jgi:hypothetical protein
VSSVLARACPDEHGLRVAPELRGEGVDGGALVVVFEVRDPQLQEVGGGSVDGRGQ